MLRRRLELIPLLLTSLAVICAAMFILMGKRIETRIGTELFTSTYEFLLVVVIGSGVSVLFQAVSYARDARERRRTLQRDIHDTLIAGYNDAKRARRLLRARARVIDHTSPALLDAGEYDRQMEAISSAQLAIELATRRIQMNRTIFPKRDDLIASLTTVGKYLNGVIDEWEDVRPAAVDGHRPLISGSVPELTAFLQHFKDSPRFHQGFKIPFDRVLELLEQALVSEV